MRFLYVRVFLTLLLGVIFVSSLEAQVNYEPLRSSGVIPDDFIQATEEKYKKEVEEIESGDAGNGDKKYQKEFALGSNFGVDQLLLNGSVLFNDSISMYVQSIAKIILKDDKETFNALRFYTLKEDVANAFTTANGIIFVTTGLMARLENEAQLAYILCHEISHYTLKHGKNNYVKREKLIRGESGSNDMSIMDKTHVLFGYSKASEYEADEIGLDLFMKTKYSKVESFKSFDVLKKANEPLNNDQGFNFVALENPYYNFPERLFIEELKEKKENEDGDTFSTHPAAEKRQYKLELMLDEMEIDGEEYILGEAAFKRIQYISRMEYLLALANDGQFVRALFDGSYLQTVYPDNVFIAKIISYSFYSLSKADLGNDMSDYVIKDDFGNLSELNYFIKKLRETELVVLAAKQLYINYKLDTSNAFNRRLLKDQLFDVMRKELMFKDFDLPKPLNDSIQRAKDSIEIEKKYGDKLTTAQKSRKLDRKARKQEKDYYMYAFYSIIQKDPHFKEFFLKTEKEYKKAIVDEETEKYKNDDYLMTRYSRQKGVAIGLEAMALMSPEIRTLIWENYRVKYKDQLKDLEYERKIKNMFVDNGRDIGIDVTVIEERGANGLTTESYNVRSAMLGYINAKASVSFRKQIVLGEEHQEEIYQEYGTLNIGLFTITNAPNKRLYLTLIVLELDTDGIPHYFNYRFKTKFKPKVIDSHIYHLLNQLHTKKK